MNVKIKTMTLALVAGLAFTSCTTQTLCIKGDEGVETREFTVDAFSGIDLQVDAEVTIHQGPQSVQVRGHRNVLDQLNNSTQGETWGIEFRDDCFRNYELKIDITVPNLSQVVVNSAGKVQIMDFEKQADLYLLVVGDGTIQLNKFEGLNTLTSAINGGGSIVANELNQLKQNTVSLNGNGAYYAYQLAADVSKITIIGSAMAYVHTGSMLDVSINGAGDVYYKGIPKVNFNIEGTGQIIRTQ